MVEFRDKSGSVVYRIGDNDIYDTSGKRLYEIRGNDIYDTSGKRLYEIRGNDLYDTSGTRLGDINDLRGRTTPGGTGSKSGGFGFWAILGLLFFAFWHFLKGPFVAFSLLKTPSARKEWWGTIIRTLLLTLLCGGIIASIVQGEIGGIILVIILIAFGLLPIVVVCIRRMHDIGRSGWWSLIPFVGFVMCGFFRSKTEGNKYI